MAGAGLGRGVRLIAGGKHRPLARQLRQPAGEAAAILREQIGGELIDRDRDDQLWRNRRGVLSEKGSGDHPGDGGDRCGQLHDWLPVG